MGTNERAERRAGHTLTEVAIVLAIVAVVTVIAIPQFNRASASRELRDTASAADGGFRNARGEAIRTGNIHLIFFQVDSEGNQLVDTSGDVVQALILDDGAPGSPGQNCKIDAGERTYTITGLADMGLDLTNNGKLPTGGSHGFELGTEFVDPAGNPATWAMFRPEGMPFSFDKDCNVGDPGSGAGRLIMKTEERAYMVELLPMGTTKVKTYNFIDGSWK